MSNEITYMDCWRFIAPLIPNTIDYAQIFVMTFLALQEAEKRKNRKEPPEEGGAENAAD